MMMMLLMIKVLVLVMMILVVLMSRGGERNGQRGADHSWRGSSIGQTGEGRRWLRQRIEDKYGGGRHGHDTTSRLLVLGCNHDCSSVGS